MERVVKYYDIKNLKNGKKHEHIFVLNTRDPQTGNRIWEYAIIAGKKKQTSYTGNASKGIQHNIMVRNFYMTKISSPDSLFPLISIPSNNTDAPFCS